MLLLLLFTGVMEDSDVHNGEDSRPTSSLWS